MLNTLHEFQNSQDYSTNKHKTADIYNIEIAH